MSSIRDLHEKVDRIQANELPHLKEDIGGLRIDIAGIKADVSWLKRGFWWLVGGSLTAALASLANFFK